MNYEMLDLLIEYWYAITILTVLVLGAIINAFDSDKIRVGFECNSMPHMRPIPIPTKSKGFWGAVWCWLNTTRRWELTKAYTFKVNEKSYTIPKGYVFDGASIPKPLRILFSPTGILLTGALIHDHLYEYNELPTTSVVAESVTFTRKEADQLFRDISIEVNGFVVVNYLAYYAVRIGGVFNWVKAK